MNEDGTVELLTGAAGLGTGAHTALAQIVAEELGILSRTSPWCTATPTSSPWDIGAFASHTTYMVGTADADGGRGGQAAVARARRRRARGLGRATWRSRDGVIRCAAPIVLITVRKRRAEEGPAGGAVRGQSRPIIRPSPIRSRPISSRWRSIPRPARSRCCRSCPCTRSAR